MLKIGELASETDTKVETIRYYERIGVLPPPERTASNYRMYGEAHVVRLSFVRKARSLGFTLDQVRELLSLSDDRTRSCSAVDEIASAHLEMIEMKIGDLTALQAELRRLIGSCKGGTVADCLIIEALAKRA